MSKDNTEQLREQLANSESEHSAIYRRVSRMTTLEGEARENGGVMAMLDEISERMVHDYERAEKAIADARRYEAELALVGSELYRASARLRAVTEAMDEAVACIDCADFGGARQILIRTIRAAKSGDLPPHPDTAKGAI